MLSRALQRTAETCQEETERYRQVEGEGHGGRGWLTGKGRFFFPPVFVIHISKRTVTWVKKHGAMRFRRCKVSISLGSIWPSSKDHFTDLTTTSPWLGGCQENHFRNIIQSQFRVEHCYNLPRLYVRVPLQFDMEPETWVPRDDSTYSMAIVGFRNGLAKHFRLLADEGRCIEAKKIRSWTVQNRWKQQTPDKY